jgi:hypothetical protein
MLVLTRGHHLRLYHELPMLPAHPYHVPLSKRSQPLLDLFNSYALRGGLRKYAGPLYGEATKFHDIHLRCGRDHRLLHLLPYSAALLYSNIEHILHVTVRNNSEFSG